MSNLTVIIPLHKFDEDYSALLQNALKSIDTTTVETDVTIVGPKDVLDAVKKEEYATAMNLHYIKNEESDYCTQVNVAVSKIKTPFFSVLEVDDEYTPNWMNSAVDYMAENSDAAVYLPLTKMIDSANEKFVGFINEVGWARGFYDTPGYLRTEGLMNYYDYNVSGALIRRDSFLAVGGLKPSIKLFFWYEFLLRCLKEGEKLYVVPKIGYTHYVNRPDSLIMEYNKTLSKEETDFWLQTAQEEASYKEDRKKTYTE